MNAPSISPEKQRQLEERMRALGIREGDLVENFIRGSGSGGQKINKTASCVQLLHRPSGLEVRCQQTRSQSMNRYLARRQICEKIEEKILGAQSAKQQEIERIRRQKRRRSRKQKQKILEGKRQQSDKKKLRKPVSQHD